MMLFDTPPRVRVERDNPTPEQMSESRVMHLARRVLPRFHNAIPNPRKCEVDNEANVGVDGNLKREAFKCTVRDTSRPGALRNPSLSLSLSLSEAEIRGGHFYGRLIKRYGSRRFCARLFGDLTLIELLNRALPRASSFRRSRLEEPGFSLPSTSCHPSPPRLCPGNDNSMGRGVASAGHVLGCLAEKSSKNRR